MDTNLRLEEERYDQFALDLTLVKLAMSVYHGRSNFILNNVLNNYFEIELKCEIEMQRSKKHLNAIIAKIP